MHIAFFSDQHPASLGGLQVSLGLQRKHLERLGHTVTVCAPDSRRTPSRQYGRESDVLLPARQAGEHSFCLAGERFDRAVDDGFSRRPPVDVVHVQADVWGAWNGYRFAERHGLPVVHTMHTDVENGLPGVVRCPRAVFRLLFALQRRYLGARDVRSVAGYTRVFAERASLVVAPSPHFAERLRSYGVEGEIEVLPTGVDDDLLAAVRGSSDPASGATRTAPALPRRPRPVLLWPGRVSREKLLDDALRALARSRADAELHVYGAGSELGRCRRLAAELGLGARVRFFGATPHDAVLRAMAEADAVVQTSVGYETQGLTLYEAASVGTPAILRDAALGPDLPEPLRLAADDTSVEALAAAVDRFVEGWRRGSGRRAPTDRFAQSRLSARAELVYERVLAEHRSRRLERRARIQGPVRAFAVPSRSAAGGGGRGLRIETEALGSRTAVYAYGTEGAPAILAVHGFRGTHFGLEPLALALAETGFRVLAPDLPGMGESAPLRGRHDARHYGLWLGELADRLSPREPALLLGHSFGSVVVASAIADGADHAGSVLVNPILSPPLLGTHRAATALARTYYSLAERAPEHIGRGLLANRTIAALSGELMTATRDRGLRRWIRSEHRRHAGAFASREVVLETYRASTRSTVAQHAAAFARPTLVLGSGRDPLCPAHFCTPEASGLHAATFRVFEAGGHLLPSESPREAAGAVALWHRAGALGGPPAPAGPAPAGNDQSSTSVIAPVSASTSISTVRPSARSISTS